MSSPDPMVSEAMIAPGPKIVSHDAGFREVNAAKGVRQSLKVRSANYSAAIKPWYRPM